ncbi:MAG: AMP-binding protein, partial [Bacteroidia bacterium]
MEIQKGETFVSHLQKTQQDYINFQGNDSLSLSEIQTQTIDNQSIFDHILIFENYPTHQLISKDNNTNWQLLQTEIISQFEHSTYPLNVIFIPENEKLTIQFDFNKKVYDASFIAFVAENLQQIFYQLPALSHQPIQEISIYSEKQQHRLTEIFHLNYQTQPNADIFQAIYQPHQAKNIAIYAEEERLTYEELRKKVANQKAVLQNNYQIKEGDSAVVLANRSVAQVVNLLAIMELEAIYTPIDTNYPQERIDYILNDTNIMCLIDENNQITAVTTNPKESHRTEKIAYTIYTSGSTGVPKGIYISKDNLQQFVFGLQKTYFQEVTNEDAFLYIASPAFDIALFEVLLPLVSGMKLVLVSNEYSLDFQYLIEKINLVSYLHLVPALLKNFCITCLQQQQTFPLVKQIFTGGDKVPLDIARITKKVFPHA